jgi:DNA-binding MarR family transcriptional regulator
VRRLEIGETVLVEPLEHVLLHRLPGHAQQRADQRRQAVNYLLGELERRGYLERRADPQDGRSRRVWLTARGVEAVGVIREAVSEMETAWSQQLGEQRFARLRTLLVDLNKLT